MERFTGLIGLVVIVAVAWLFSANRGAIKLRVLLWGLGLQFGFAFLVLKTPLASSFQTASNGVNHLLEYAAAGSSFVFGDKLGVKNDQFGVVFAFQVLPIVIFIASLFAVLYYLGVMQIVVKALALIMQKVMGTSGAESLNVAASIFMGQTEAPLTIRPFLAGLTESELFTVMVSGMAHVSGAVMAAYVLIAGVEIRHLLTAVIMTAPATLMLAKMLMPETGTPVTAGGVKVDVEKPGVNIIDAASRGASDGLQLALNIGAMLIAFIGLIALVNGILGAARRENRLDSGFDAVHSGPHLRAHRLAAWREVERLFHGRQSARHAPHPQRICRLRRSGQRSDTRSTRDPSSSRPTPCAASPI
jgi:CNT family concentrative nucleoside transporter